MPDVDIAQSVGIFPDLSQKLLITLYLRQVFALLLPWKTDARLNLWLLRCAVHLIHFVILVMNNQSSIFNKPRIPL
jgi:hypothetical protein